MQRFNKGRGREAAPIFKLQSQFKSHSINSFRIDDHLVRCGSNSNNINKINSFSTALSHQIRITTLKLIDSTLPSPHTKSLLYKSADGWLMNTDRALHFKSSKSTIVQLILLPLRLLLLYFVICIHFSLNTQQGHHFQLQLQLTNIGLRYN